MGYTQFANFISDSIEPRGIGYSKEDKSRIKIKKIRAVFNNRLIVIDEVHNIRITHENKNKKTAELLTHLFNNDPNKRDAYIHIRNKSKCKKFKKPYNLCNGY